METIVNKADEQNLLGRIAVLERDMQGMFYLRSKLAKRLDAIDGGGV